MPKRRKHQRQLEISLGCLLFLLCVWASTLRLAAQAPAGDSQPVTNAIYLPVISRGATAPSVPTLTATPTMPTVPTVPTATSTATPTTPVPTTPPNAPLPDAIVGTWYNGNAPLNDFYDPNTGQWQDVNGLGQMYNFAANGVYSYTGFLRIQNGACRSEVSTFQRGVAQTTDSTLVLAPDHVKTRTVTICGNTTESITDGPYDPSSQGWLVGEDNFGHEQLTVSVNGVDTTYYKAGMAASLAGVWQSADLAPAGFYDPATNQFDLESPIGMWFDFGLDSTYRYGERNHGTPDELGCSLEWWIYHQGTISVVGGKITVTPQSGMLRLYEPCHPETVQQKPWVDEMRDYTWFYRDRTSDTKLVLIPLLRFVEFIFQRP